jgi:hypothetical protein
VVRTTGSTPDTKITVSGGGDKELDESQKSKGERKAAGVPVQFSPEGTQFKTPATLALPFNQDLASAQGAAEKDLRVHYWNPEKREWEPLESEVDKEKKTVKAKTSHFSLYQVMAVPGGVQAQAPAGPGADPSFAFRNVYVFPNPAEGGARPIFHAAVGIADKVSFRVLDASGQEVHRAVLEGRPAVIDDGSGPQYAYEYPWEGRIPSGLYFFVMEAEKAGHGPIRKGGKFAVVR